MRSIGIIGAGKVADQHARAYRAQDRPVRLAAVADLNSQQATEFAARWEIPEVYGSVDALLDSGKVDAVDVCLPTAAHAEAAISALRRGIPVLCEKPLARTADEVRQMAAVARGTGALLLPGHNRVYFEPLCQLEALIRRGEIGAPRLFRAAFLHAYHPSAARARTGILNWRGDSSVAGGGAVIESGIHHIYTAEYLCGPISAVSAVVDNAEGRDLDIEDTALIVLEFSSGAKGMLSILWGAAYVEDGLSIVCSRGRARIAGVEWQTWAEPVLSVYHATEKRWEYPFAPGSWEQSFQSQARHFLGCLSGDEEPRVSPESGVRALAVVEAIYRAAETGRRVVVTSATEGQ